jgi:hypothetical protein
MKSPATIIRVLLTAGTLRLAAAALDVRAQEGRATDFTITEYYESPNQQRVKSILSGAEVVHRPGQPDVIKQFKLLTFNLEGQTNLVVTGPECFYDEKACTASSAGPLQVQNGDGTFRMDGEGFLWRQTNSSLTISNQVRSMADNVTQLKFKP